MIPLLGTLTGWLLFAGLVACWGAVVGYWFIACPPDTEVRASAKVSKATAEELGRIGACALPVALGFVFLRQLQEFRDPFASWTGDARVIVFGTDWGTIWVCSFILSVLVMGAFSSLKWTKESGWIAGSLLTLALSMFPALTGHASGTEGLRWISIPADVIHVVAAGVWIGGLTFILLSEYNLRVTYRAGTDTLLPVLVPRFSRIAVPAVVALLLTGVLAAWIHVPSFNTLLTTSYGQTLIVKVVFVLLVLFIGRMNWRRITPRLLDVDGPRTMRKSAAIELLFAHLVLMVTAVLIRISPMDH